MIHCCRRAELCQHSSPWAQIWTVALSYGRKSLAVGISNEELHVCRALQLIKFWGVYNFIYFPDNPLIWARRSWEMSRERVEPGQKTGTASSQFHTLSISSLIPPIPRLEWEWRMSSPTHLCRGSCVVEKTWEEWFEPIPLDIYAGTYFTLSWFYTSSFLVSLLQHVL